MKNEKRKYTGRQKFSRTPWGFYLLMAVVAWFCIVLGLCMGFGMANKADAAVPDVEQSKVTGLVPVVMEPVVVPESKPAVLEPVTVPEEPVESVPLYSEMELEILAIIIYQEAGGDACSDETRQMVGEVFLNRVASDKYPGTFYEVATQRQQYGRLYWTGIVWPERAELPQEAHAVERAYEMAEALLAGTVERLLPEDAIFQAEFEQGTETLAVQNGLYFCR